VRFSRSVEQQGSSPRASTHFPAEAVTSHRGALATACRQVFGLADVGLSTRLLAPASQPLRASALLAFVSAYRCGAVPDLHRIPFSASPTMGLRMAPTGHNISGWPGPVNPIDCGFAVDKPEKSKREEGLAKARKFSRWPGPSPVHGNACRQALDRPGETPVRTHRRPGLRTLLRPGQARRLSTLSIRGSWVIRCCLSNCW